MEIPRDEKDAGTGANFGWIEGLPCCPEELRRSSTMKSGSLCMRSAAELLEPSSESSAGEESELERRLFFLAGPSWGDGLLVCLLCGLADMENTKKNF